MRRTSLSLILSLIVTSHAMGQKPWQQLSHPKAEEVAACFQSPPPEYAVTVTWGWDGPITKEVIVRDLDLLHRHGFRAVTIEAGDGWQVSGDGLQQVLPARSMCFVPAEADAD